MKTEQKYSKTQVTGHFENGQLENEEYLYLTWPMLEGAFRIRPG